MLLGFAFKKALSFSSCRVRHFSCAGTEPLTLQPPSQAAKLTHRMLAAKTITLDESIRLYEMKSYDCYDTVQFAPDFSVKLSSSGRSHFASLTVEFLDDMGQNVNLSTWCSNRSAQQTGTKDPTQKWHFSSGVTHGLHAPSHQVAETVEFERTKMRVSSSGCSHYVSVYVYRS